MLTWFIADTTFTGEDHYVTCTMVRTMEQNILLQISGEISDGQWFYREHTHVGWIDYFQHNGEPCPGHTAQNQCNQRITDTVLVQWRTHLKPRVRPINGHKSNAVKHHVTCIPAAVHRSRGHSQCTQCWPSFYISRSGTELLKVDCRQPTVPK